MGQAPVATLRPRGPREHIGLVYSAVGRTVRGTARLIASMVSTLFGM